ncbi:MAG: amino acid permease [Nitrososphaerota archaeon]|nr:amino acid permease [Nitrososphaerota archaeon]
MKPPELKKLGFWQVVAVGLGNIVGAGIFVMAGSAINAAGPGALIAFVITSTLAVTVGLNSSELSSRFPGVEGGVYSFAKETLGETVGFLVGWFRLISYAVSGAAVALGFSGYLTGSVLGKELYYPLAALLIIVLSCVEARGLRVAARAEQGLVVFNLFGLLLFVAGVLLYSRPTGATFVPLLPHGGGGLLLAANIAFFAYSGFNTIATLTPDVERGETVVPRAIVFSLAASTLFYLVVVATMLVPVPWNSYGTASNPLAIALAASHAPGAVLTLVNLSALTATFTVTLSLIIAGSRTTKQMAADGMLPGLLGHGSWVPTAVVAAIMVASLGLGNVETIALVANFGVIFSYMLSGVEVAVARKRKVAGKFSSPGFPYVQAISVGLSVLMLVSLGARSLEFATLTLVLGLLAHLMHREFGGQKRRGEGKAGPDAASI